MKITLTGSLGNITKPLAITLIGAGHQVTIISSSADRASAIEAIGAKAAIGLITDAAFLTQAFTGADAVYLMVPPNFAASNMREYAAGIAKNYATAMQNAGVTQAVYLSSIGAHLASGTGPITGPHDVEQLFNQLDGIAVKYVRASFFYTNFFNDIPVIKNMHIIGANYPADTRLVMVHPKDIAAAIAEEIQQPITGKSVRYIASDERTPAQAAKVLGTAIGQPDLPWVQFTDEQAYAGMQQAGIPEVIAKNFIEMGNAITSGILWTDYDLHETDTSGKIKLETFAEEFAGAYGSEIRG